MITKEKFLEAQKLSFQIREVENVGDMQVSLVSTETRKLIADAIKKVIADLNVQLDALLNE